MSQPDYPIFSKRLQNNQKNWRGCYNFEKTNDSELVKKWFEERSNYKIENKQIVNNNTVTNIVANNILKPLLPPGLSKKFVINYCKICSKISNNSFLSTCCKSFLCDGCLIGNDLYNRCVLCKAIVDESLYKQYDCLDLIIPSYEDFYYIE